MKLSEMNAGDIVAIEVDGIVTIVRLGVLLGTTVAKKRDEGIAHTALVHPLDEATWRESPPRSCMAVSPDTEVVDVVDRMSLRLDRHARRRGGSGDQSEAHDPLVSGTRKRAIGW